MAIAAVLPQMQLKHLECAPHTHACCSQRPMTFCTFLVHPTRSLRQNALGDIGWSEIFKALAENQGAKIESWDLSDEVLSTSARGTSSTLLVSRARRVYLISSRFSSLPGQLPFRAEA